jgi:8-oxo-dGTP diphosphatase
VARATPAAGGVVWRRTDGAIEIGLVHRPRYDDWALPKGKIADGETVLQAAVREVAEELGVTVAVTRRLSDIRYATAAGRKTVSFWAMRCVAEWPRPGDDEVDEVTWLAPEQARRLLSYDGERQVLAEFAARPVPDSVVLLVRHARAGKRSEWRGDDDKRPLDLVGEQQALALVPLLRAFGPQRIYAAPLERCVQTVRPLADALDLEVHTDDAFSDEVCERWPDAPVEAVRKLAEARAVSVVCSQGDTIPRILTALAPKAASVEPRKGSAWVLSVADGATVAADYYDAP